MAHKITIKLILVSFFTLFSIQLNAQCEVENNNFKGGGNFCNTICISNMDLYIQKPETLR